MQNDGLHRAELFQCHEAFFAAMSAALHAAKRQLDTTASAIAVNEHLTGLDALAHACLTAAILGPDT